MELYHQKKDIVCVIKVTQKIQGVFNVTYGVGCYINKTEILTSAYLLWNKKAAKIEACRIGEENFIEVANVTKVEAYNLSLLVEVGNQSKVSQGPINLAGPQSTLQSGEQLYSISSDGMFRGSWLKGHVAYDCSLVTNFSNESKCESFQSQGCLKPQIYRKMGDLWNQKSLGESQWKNYKEFGDQLYAMLPVIQCNGFDFVQEGSPLFDKKMEVVGIFIRGGCPYKIALAVSTIHEFLSKPRRGGY